MLHLVCQSTLMVLFQTLQFSERQFKTATCRVVCFDGSKLELLTALDWKVEELLLKKKSKRTFGAAEIIPGTHETV